MSGENGLNKREWRKAGAVRGTNSSRDRCEDQGREESGPASPGRWEDNTTTDGNGGPEGRGWLEEEGQLSTHLHVLKICYPHLREVGAVYMDEFPATDEVGGKTLLSVQ